MDSPIDWERLASGAGSLPSMSHAVAVAPTHTVSEVVVADEVVPGPVDPVNTAVEPPVITETPPAEAPAIPPVG